MIKINVITNNDRWSRLIKDPLNYVNRKVKKLNLKNKIFKKKIILCTLLLSSNQEIKKLNKKFRKKNKSTDVLSFPFHNKRNLKIKLKKEKEIYLGDIIINFNKVKYKKDLNLFKLQFDKLWVHGLVHLFGHDHKNEKDFKKMSRLETDYLKFIK
jgi:probable rRNA maturation factor